MAKTKANTPAKKASAEEKKALKAATRAAGDKVLLQQAAMIPAGQSKIFLEAVAGIDKAKTIQAEQGKLIRGHRATIKGLGVPLRPFDQALKMRDLGKDDAKSFKTSQAIIEEQLGLETDPLQKALLKEVAMKHEANREAMLDASGGSTGKEIGSKSRKGAAAEEPEEEDEPSPSVPSKNEAFKPMIAATH